MKHALLLFVFVLGACSVAAAEKRESEEAELIVCSQNLGSKQNRKNLSYLAERIIRSGCNVVAVQEVSGDSKKKALKNLNKLSKVIEEFSGNNFNSYVGETNDRFIRNGFLVSSKLGEVSYSRSFSKVYLPKLMGSGPSKKFSRGPFMIQLEVAGKGGAKKRKVKIYSVHFKSKRNPWKDKSNTSFETLRVQMAEALRVLAQTRSDDVIIIAGDLNSRVDSATAAVLSGGRVLSDFQFKNSCSISKKLSPSCKTSARPEVFTPLLGKSSKKLASYRHNKSLELIDDIYMNGKNSWMSEEIGVSGEFWKGSDHKLVWARINW